MVEVWWLGAFYSMLVISDVSSDSSLIQTRTTSIWIFSSRKKELHITCR